MVKLKQLGSEKNEPVRVRGRRVDAIGLSCTRVRRDSAFNIVLKELDIDAVKASCGARCAG